MLVRQVLLVGVLTATSLAVRAGKAFGVPELIVWLAGIFGDVFVVVLVLALLHGSRAWRASARRGIASPARWCATEPPDDGGARAREVTRTAAGVRETC